MTALGNHDKGGHQQHHDDADDDEQRRHAGPLSAMC
jgi:hypothetical protein